MTNKTKNTGLKEKWQYLQEEVLEECWHSSSLRWNHLLGKDQNYCPNCDKVFLYFPTNCDFSTPDDFYELEQEMKKQGEFGKFAYWLHHVRGYDYNYIVGNPAQRAELIYEYFKQKES